jgi:hypothetical protein
VIFHSYVCLPEGILIILYVQTIIIHDNDV